MVFGLDGVLCDPRPRTARILGELAEAWAPEVPELADALARLGPAQVRYHLSHTLRQVGISATARVRDATRFWQDRFFSDAYCGWDEAMPGAVEFVRACHEAGARVVYLTTRDAPGMLLGTVASLRDLGFPVAVPGVELVLKPHGTMSDEAFHHGFLPGLHRAGEVAAFFDNAPAACNFVRARHPGAEVVLLETFPVPGPPDAADGVQLAADLRMA